MNAFDGANKATIHRVAVETIILGGNDSTEVKVEIATPATTTLAIGETLQLLASASGSSDAITWSSSDQAVATVDANGLVTAVSGDEVVITATCGTVSKTIELTVEKAFYLAKTKTFTNVLVQADGSAELDDPIYLNWYEDTNNFVRLLPNSMKNDSAIAEKFTTLEGIKELVKSFEFQYEWTQATTKDGGESWDPQAVAVIEGSDFDWEKGVNKWDGVGPATPDAPKTKTITVLTDGSDGNGFSKIEADTLGKVAVKIGNAKPDTTVSGAYSIKVNLN